MKRWAGACLISIREILFRAAERIAINLTPLVKHEIRIKPKRNKKFLRVTQGFDGAGNESVGRCEAVDPVVSVDIPLAADIITHFGLALSPRGELFTCDNIRVRLTMRDLMESLRPGGIKYRRLCRSCSHSIDA